MGIDDRRERERKKRRDDILDAAWTVAGKLGWSAFSVERVAAEAELGRATVYAYFVSIDELVAEMGRGALELLQERLAQAESTEEALDVPVRLSQASPAHFELLFPQAKDTRSHMSSSELTEIRETARELLGRLSRVAERQATALPEDARSRAAFLAGVSMAGAAVPELRASTTLRHQWQEFCLGSSRNPAPMTETEDEAPSVERPAKT